MDVHILEEDENQMLHRTDVRFEVAHEEETPSRLSVRDSLAAKLAKDSEEVVVHELDTKFGMRKTVGYAKVY
ncbi:MAG: 30S ribosomal protein S24e, partial [Halobacteriales archaeon]